MRDFIIGALVTGLSALVGYALGYRRGIRRDTGSGTGNAAADRESQRIAEAGNEAVRTGGEAASTIQEIIDRIRRRGSDGDTGEGDN